MVNLYKKYRIDVICDDILPSIINSYSEDFWTEEEAREKIDNYINDALGLTESYYEILSIKYIWEKNHKSIDEMVDKIKE